MLRLLCCYITVRLFFCSNSPSSLVLLFLAGEAIGLVPLSVVQTAQIIPHQDIEKSQDASIRLPAEE